MAFPCPNPQADMNPPTNQERFSPPWLLLVGLLLGGGLLVLMAWDSIAHSFKRAPGSAQVVELTEENWQKEVVESKIPVMVDFWATWCGPCLDFAPTIHNVAVTYEGKVKVGKLDVDKAQKIAARYGIKNLPSVLFFKGGDEPVLGFEGKRHEAELVKALDSLLAKK
jgi:thioredoxin 1